MFSRFAKTGYERHKTKAARRQQGQSRAGRELPPIPPPENPARYESCRRNFRLFCESYYPQTFSLAWSDDHLLAIGKIETAVLAGDLFALAMPRGSGKTSLCEIAALWSVIYGHHPFCVLIGASETKAVANMATIQTELETNDLLDADFPAVTRPIRALEGIANRARGQLYEGQRTALVWNNKRLILPTIKDSPASGAIIIVAGLTSSQVRGPKYKRRDGSTVRPSIVIIDDPQTDQSAKNEVQNKKREQILAGAILGMAGPGKRIAGLMPCTVIRPNDMADRILDRTQHPEWKGQRTKLLYEFPTDTALWDQYNTVFLDEGQETANRFYAAHRESMDAGAKVAWPARKTEAELSALQHAMSLYYRDPAIFMAEYQNDPQPETLGDLKELKPSEIAQRVNLCESGAAPIWTEKITAFIDVQESVLFYCVTAWSTSYAGAVLEYGTWPDQRRRYFAKRDLTETIAKHTRETSLEARLTVALETLYTYLQAQSYQRDDGSKMPVSQTLVDANWGQSTDTVYAFCGRKARILPSHGKFVGASSMPMSEYRKRPGDRVGSHWRIPALGNRRQIRHSVYDTNYWKSFIHARLAEPIGGKSALTLFGSNPAHHQRFSEHLTAEYRVRVEGRGRTVDEWKLRPERPDNDWLDCLVGSAVAASIEGITTSETKQAPKETIDFAAAQRKARENRIKATRDQRHPRR